MKRMFFLMSFGFCAMMLAAQQASAAQCADHATVVQRLAERYGETRQSIGLAHNNTVVEVFASLDTGTWTITITRAGGPTCLAAAGQAYQATNDPMPLLGPET